MVDLGMIWHVYGIVCAFILLTARLAPTQKSYRLTLAEIVAASFPVGMICNVWLVFIIACLTSAIGCVDLSGPPTPPSKNGLMGR